MRVSLTIEVNRPTLGRSRRRRFLAGVIIAALLVPSAVLANHLYTDVPTDHLFHSDITKAKGAGLTSGCTATTFCPDTAVSRGQMTAFLNRGLGRATAAYLSGNVSSSTLATIGTITIRAGNPTGGSQQVMLLASVYAKTNGAGCPCEVFIGLYRSNGTAVGVDMFIDVAAIPAGQGFTDENGTLLGLVTVPTGVDQTFLVKASRPAGSANLEVGGRFQAITVPFIGTGDAPPS